MSDSQSAGTPAQRQSTCFVVTGFGNKTDYATGRVLNLDKTYEQLIRPAFDRAGINCFRAIDANLTGSIDSVMYKWIYEADFVIADLSTLNANVFYELGVRHAQKPHATIIIAESVLMQKIPFDLSSFVIHQYEHGGEEIAEAEQKRFVDHLEGLLKEITAVEAARLEAGGGTKRATDSPVFTFLENMTAPTYELPDQLEPPRWVPPEQRTEQEDDGTESLGKLIAQAEAAKNAKDYPRAIELFGKTVEGGMPKPDLFLAQRLALVTYKNGEGDDKAVAESALNEAEGILAKHCAPRISTDPETLGLSGAINKRLFELTGDTEYLDRSIAFYERGFYVKQDYYTGINVAFMYTVRANLMEGDFEAIVSFGHGNMIRKKVAQICVDLIEDDAAFQQRGDKEWVYMTLAEAYQGMRDEKGEARLSTKIESEASDFGKDAYLSQKEKLRAAIAEFDERMQGRGRPTGMAGAEPSRPASASGAPATSALVTHVNAPPPGSASERRVLTIDADVARDRTIRSVELNCRIEYE